MKLDGAMSNFKSHPTDSQMHVQTKVENYAAADIGLTINYQDPDAPPENIIEKMSECKKSWIAALLRPFDMCYHLCNDARQILTESYQNRINDTLGSFEESIENMQLELKELLGYEDFNQLSRLYMICTEYKEKVDEISLLHAKEKKMFDSINAHGTDCNNNKKNDITPEYTNAQIKKMSDFETLNNKLNEKKILYKKAKSEIDAVISSLEVSSLTKSMLYILNEGANLRTPLLLEQLAFTTAVPEIPGAYSKVGIQMQIVFPSRGAIKKLFNSKPIENIFIQPFFHLEEGISGAADLSEYMELPFNVKLAAGALRVNHFGINIPINRSKVKWQCEKVNYVIEMVNRFEGGVNLTGDKLSTPLSLQLKVGVDTVRQLVFSSNKTGTTRFMVQLALRAIGAVATGYAALALGASAPTAKACSMVGADAVGVLCEMIEIIEPDCIVDIIEPLTLGIDFSANTKIQVPYLGTLDFLSMQRLNSGFVVEHDIKKDEIMGTDNSKNTMLSATSMNEMEIRHRKSSVTNKSASIPSSCVTTV